ncbi:HicB family protein [Desulfonatronospira thiodismutans ASO3-1]|uniref:HicB family protein n=1 Tax=Desulfonatronospira thiodismutans ASO3-1 TaxID=555779 RepID=D6SNB3_9BACT|nr:toxin-antitoxin system HicB family antitoxin [Desulfonatronospira thiodismutans]EFI34239.1 HicB family protein [Desulfonatronospira thiodismutans ASO3-1]
MTHDKKKEYSGQFRLRLPRDLHARLAEEASRQGVSLNGYVVYLLSSNLSQAQTSAYFEEKIADTVMEVHEMVSSMTVGDNEPGEMVWANSGSSSLVTQ